MSKGRLKIWQWVRKLLHILNFDTSNSSGEDSTNKNESRSPEKVLLKSFFKSSSAKSAKENQQYQSCDLLKNSKLQIKKLFK